MQYNPGSYRQRQTLFARLYDYLRGVTLARAQINAIKPRFFDFVTGDVLEVGGSDNFFKKRYQRGSVFNLDKAPSAVVDIQANAESMPVIASSSCGGIICISVLEHTADHESMLSEFYRCLASDGLLMLSVPWIFEEHMAPEDYHRFSIHQIKKMLSGKFEIQEIHFSNGYFGLVAHFLQRNLALRYLLGWLFFLASLGETHPASEFSSQITIIARKH